MVNLVEASVQKVIDKADYSCYTITLSGCTFSYSLLSEHNDPQPQTRYSALLDHLQLEFIDLLYRS